MNSDYEQFKGVGGYTNKRIQGSFEGTFRLFPDGRVIGSTIDSGRDIDLGGGKKKLIVGLNNHHLGRMNFWKLCNVPELMPLMYTLGCSGENSYDGLWVPVDVRVEELVEGMEGNEGLRQVGSAFQLTDECEILDELGEIPRENIEACIHSGLICGICELGEERGYLNLHRLS